MNYRNWIKSSALKPMQSYGDRHWTTFEDFRKKHNENVCLETNKLVLRLDKLINPDDGSKPDLDKSIVEWTSDNLVKLCPFCAKNFTVLARRRHHCRSCGAILCGSCSRFLEYKAACKLVRPAKLYTDRYDRIEDRLQNKDANDMPKIRICEDCERLLTKRIQTIEDYYCQPVFYELYDKVRKCMAEADQLILSHASIISDQKQPDSELKHKIQDLKQEVIALASKLGKLSEKETGKQAYLLGAVKQSVGSWLKESIDSKSNRIYGTRTNTSSGWVSEQPACTPETDAEENPLLIQIRNLEEYIKQARSADKYEEVSVLEESKRDLEIEYLLQQDLAITD